MTGKQMKERLEKLIVKHAMARYKHWKKEHPEGPLPPHLEGGMRYRSGYNMVRACERLARLRASK